MFLFFVFDKHDSQTNTCPTLSAFASSLDRNCGASKVGSLVETVKTVATFERKQFEVDFAQNVLWELITKTCALGADARRPARVVSIGFPRKTGL